MRTDRHPSTPRWCGELCDPRTSASSEPSTRSSARYVFEFPPSTARTSGPLIARAPVRGEPVEVLLVGREQPLDQLLRRPPLPDERMGEQRLARVGGVATECGGDGEPLVGRHVLRRPEQFRCERRLRQRDGDAVLDARRHLDDVVVGEPRERAVVPDVDLVQLAGAGGERCHEARRRLAVEGAAPLLQQRRLLVDLRIAVDLEQVLARSRRRRPREEFRRAARPGRRRARRSSGGSTTESLRDPRAAAAAAPPRRPARRVLGEQRREHVLARDADGADPREVVEADLIHLDELGSNAQHRPQATLESDRDVAEADARDDRRRAARG